MDESGRRSEQTATQPAADEGDGQWMWAGLKVQRTRQQQPVFYPRGRGLGGTSTVNAQFVIRGLPEDFEDWVSTHGCVGWGWGDVLPYYQRVEGARSPLAPQGDAAEADEDEELGWTTDGPIPVTTAPLKMMKKGVFTVDLILVMVKE